MTNAGNRRKPCKTLFLWAFNGRKYSILKIKMQVLLLQSAHKKTQEQSVPEFLAVDRGIEPLFPP